MDLKVNLQNCYGINALEHRFDFSRGNCSVFSVYAPNGTLKTSLAKTFKDIQFGKDTTDQIFSERTTVRDVEVNGEPITEAQVMVIDSYDESYSAKQLSRLLVNQSLKQNYDEALKQVADKKAELLKAVGKYTGKRGAALSELFTSVFGTKSDQFIELIVRLNAETLDDWEHFAKYKFDQLFKDKVVALVKDPSFSAQLANYVQVYDRLIEQSPVLTRKFNHQNAAGVAKDLDTKGFFGAQHSVNIHINDGFTQVETKQELEALLLSEQQKVLGDEALQQQFQLVDSQLKNKDLQDFRDLIAQHPALLAEYANLELFKKGVLCGYLQACRQEWQALATSYQANQQVIREIVEQAKGEQSTWQLVAERFNERFSVPFKLIVENQHNVILQDEEPVILFEFSDGRDTKENLSKNDVLCALSQGEKRALYILNVLFEVEAKRQADEPVLVIIDDIADSFDYKNKYAIVEYLADLAKEPNFNLLLLTHNFDFHRIIGSRVIGNRANRLMASKSAGHIKIFNEKYQKDVFNAWKGQLHSNILYRLGCIPFARNVAEYCGAEADYDLLTQLMHIKQGSQALTFADLQAVYRRIFVDKQELVLPHHEDPVLECIYAQATALCGTRVEQPELEHKVILAMAIRLKAEEFMINAIADSEFVSAIQANQTRELFNRYKVVFPDNSETIALLDQVNLMTPENIHLNSFMYEPILDMSAERLCWLYQKVSELALVPTLEAEPA